MCPLFTDMRIGFQPIPNELVECLSCGKMANAFDDLSRKRVNQHALGGIRPNTSSAQVKNGFFIELSNRRPMCAFHIICVNFKLGFCVNSRVIREQQVLIGLFCIGLLGWLTYQDAAMKDSFRLTVQNAVEIFVAVAMGLGVLYHHMMV